jgi:hypothetical protein
VSAPRARRCACDHLVPVVGIQRHRRRSAPPRTVGIVAARARSRAVVVWLRLVRMLLADPAFRTMTAHRSSARSCEFRERIDLSPVVVEERQALRTPRPAARIPGQRFFADTHRADRTGSQNSDAAGAGPHRSRMRARHAPSSVLRLSDVRHPDDRTDPAWRRSAPVSDSVQRP